MSQFSTTYNRRRFLQATGCAAVTLLAGPNRLVWGQDPDQQAVKQWGEQLLVHSEQPLNAEPRLDDLVESWITPIRHFYIRNHGKTPTVPENYTLTIEGMVNKPLTITLPELRDRFQPVKTTATLICGGNRRNEHSRVKKVSGVQWEAGAIGNAEWGGIRLSDVLKKAGLKDGAKHVWFTGHDQITDKGQTFPFGGSVPLEKAMADTESAPGTLLAWEMNQKPLATVHGFPLRTIVPGYIGARSVKWLSKITVSDRPSPNHFVADAYKLVQDETEAPNKPPIYEFPITSAIAVPAAGARLDGDKARLRGYALPTGAAGNIVKKVEVSTDGGKSWHAVEFIGPGREFCWRLWEGVVPITRQTESLIVRATDSRGEMQPRRVEWNLKGYLFNAWHEIPVKTT